MNRPAWTHCLAVVKTPHGQHMDRRRRAVVSTQLKVAAQISSGQEKRAATAQRLRLVAVLMGSQLNLGKEQTMDVGAKNPSTVVVRLES